MAMSSYTKDELEVASILLEVPTLFLQNSPSRFDQVRWGAKRRRTEPSYRIPDRVEPAAAPPVEEEERKKKGETASPSTPLSFPASCGEDPILSSPLKRVKKPTRHKEWVKEKKEMVAALSERKSDLLREIGVVKEKFQRLQAFNSFLRDQKPKLQQNEEIILRQILPSNQNPPFGATWTPPQPVVLGIEQQRRIFNFDLNESPSDDAAAEQAEVLAWPAELPLKTAKELRRERLEKQREKYRGRVSKTSSSPSTAPKRPRVR